VPKFVWGIEQWLNEVLPEYQLVTKATPSSGGTDQQINLSELTNGADW